MAAPLSTNAAREYTKAAESSYSTNKRITATNAAEGYLSLQRIINASGRSPTLLFSSVQRRRWWWDVSNSPPSVNFNSEMTTIHRYEVEQEDASNAWYNRREMRSFRIDTLRRALVCRQLIEAGRGGDIAEGEDHCIHGIEDLIASATTRMNLVSSYLEPQCSDLRVVRVWCFVLNFSLAAHMWHLCLLILIQLQIKQRVIDSVLDEQDRQRQEQRNVVPDPSLIAFRSMVHSQASRVRARSIGLYHERDYEWRVVGKH